MTNKEAVEHLKDLKTLRIEFPNALQEQALDLAIKALEERPQGDWIPVSERLPQIGEAVLCQCRANIFEVLRLTNDGWLHDNKYWYMMSFVIAWQPLPEPYKEVENV